MTPAELEITVRAVAATLNEQRLVAQQAEMQCDNSRAVLSTSSATLRDTATALLVSVGRRVRDVPPALVDVINRVAEVLTEEAQKLGLQAASLDTMETVLAAQVETLNLVAPQIGALVPAPTLVSLDLAPASASVVVGGTQQFTASAVWSDGSTTLPALAWTSSGGTVSSTGLFSATVVGAGSVSVAGGDKTDSAVVTVTDVVTPGDPVVLYRDTFTDGKHSPSTNGVFYGATSSPFVFTKDAQGRDVFRLLIPADGNDNRNEIRFGGFGRRTELFVGFKRRMSPGFTHENMDGPDNFKQLRLFSNPYEVAGGIHVGFSLLPGGTPGGFGQILFEPTGIGTPSTNKGTWDRVALADVDERWGFYVQLASGPGAFDGVMQFWYQGVDLMKKQMDAAIAAGKPFFNWNAMDLWNYSATPRNYFDAGFYPGWDNAGSTNEEYIDFQEFVLATAPLPEYTTP